MLRFKKVNILNLLTISQRSDSEIWIRRLIFPYYFIRIKGVKAIRNRRTEVSHAHLPECSNNLCRLCEYSSQ